MNLQFALKLGLRKSVSGYIGVRGENAGGVATGLCKTSKLPAAILSVAWVIPPPRNGYLKGLL